jgi:phosphatidate cytidylyltransferase
MSRPDPYGRPAAPEESGRGDQRAWHAGAAPGGGPHPADGYPTDAYPTAGHGPDAYPTDAYPTTRPDTYPANGYGHGAYVDPADLPMTEQPVRPRRPGPGKRRASSRAGRNLPAAIGVGVLLGAIILGSLFIWKPAFLGVLALAIAIGVWEVGRAVRSVDADPPLVPLIGGGVIMVGLAWFAGPDALSLGLLVTVLAALVWRLADGPAGYQRDMTATALIAVYVPFLASFGALLAVPDDGALRILVTLAAVVLSDTGGYAFGVFLGKHPMAPSISPKKSWEGFAGSVVSASAGSAVLLYLIFDVAPWWGAVFGAAISVAAVLGDLAESMIKRDLGIKDMSTLLPGHGGLMDRFDSILFALPTAYLLLSLFTPVTSG